MLLRRIYKKKKNEHIAKTEDLEITIWIREQAQPKPVKKSTKKSGRKKKKKTEEKILIDYKYRTSKMEPDEDDKVVDISELQSLVITDGASEIFRKNFS
jgi:hypothetical protein